MFYSFKQLIIHLKLSGFLEGMLFDKHTLQLPDKSLQKYKYSSRKLIIKILIITPAGPAHIIKGIFRYNKSTNKMPLAFLLSNV